MGFHSTQWIKDQGFNRFKTISELRASKLTSVPQSPGVYLILKNHIAKPQFQAKSAAAWFKGKDPSIDPVELRKRWICQLLIEKGLISQEDFFQTGTPKLDSKRPGQTISENKHDISTKRFE
jgi:hypothetical protein